MAYYAERCAYFMRTGGGLLHRDQPFPAPIRYSQADNERFVALYRLGYSEKEIAKEMKCHPITARKKTAHLRRKQTIAPTVNPSSIAPNE